MTDTARRAADARALLDDGRLTAVLDEIVEDAQRAFLASRGDPAALTAAYRKTEAVATLRAALQARLLDQAVADKREQHRARHD